MTTAPHAKAAPQTQTLPDGELSDRDLEAVSAGSRANCAEPLDPKNANNSSDFRKRT